MPSIEQRLHRLEQEMDSSGGEMERREAVLALQEEFSLDELRALVKVWEPGQDYTLAELRALLHGRQSGQLPQVLDQRSK